MEQTDCKPYQPLPKVKHEMDLAYTSSSDESEDGRKPRQTYNSRETLHEYNQELRMNYNSQSRKRKEVEKSTQEYELTMVVFSIKLKEDYVHVGHYIILAAFISAMEIILKKKVDMNLSSSDKGNAHCLPAAISLKVFWRLAVKIQMETAARTLYKFAKMTLVMKAVEQASPFFIVVMEFCETPHTLCSGYQTDMHSVSRHGYQLEMGSDVDTETEGAASPDHALRMWIRGMKSEHSSCLSSRANSALSLTDTDHERKSDGENGFKFSPVCCDMEAQAGSTQGKCFQIFDDKLFYLTPSLTPTLQHSPLPV
ncbi:hypothetical protein E2I00_000601 [Balaenoptera physalus]|uniref:Teneurin N-terminal domain-containing protein n=1 Tax=Balaenoptera physalus TaxID=9770 RepID=A0A6A1Q8L4_BALPH|nr:hypothetical protein E2I00_000601 [Balaenoptera physalus]